MAPPRIDFMAPPSFRGRDPSIAPKSGREIAPPSLRDLERPSVRQAFAAVGHAILRTVDIHPDVMALYDFAAEDDPPADPQQASWRGRVDRFRRAIDEGRWSWYIEAWVPALALHAASTVKEGAARRLQSWRDSALRKVRVDARRETKPREPGRR